MIIHAAPNLGGLSVPCCGRALIDVPPSQVAAVASDVTCRSIKEINPTGSTYTDVRGLLRANPGHDFTIAAVYEYFGADDPDAETDRATIRRSLALLAREPSMGVTRARRGVYRSSD